MWNASKAVLLGLGLLLAQGVSAYTHHVSSIQWMAYSDAAFARAQAENKPIFMLISAVWCYNCHIYEVTLDTPPVADTLNRAFIPIFVDYDRRQDLARAYPAVGIPVTVILAPNGEHLVSVPGAIAQTRLLASLNKTLRFLADEYRPEVVAATKTEPKPLQPLSRALLKNYLDRFDQQISTAFDPAYGGFGLAQKEPHAELLLRLLERQRSGDQRWREPLRTTLDAILGPGKPTPAEPRPPFETLLRLRGQQTDLLAAVQQLQEQDKLTGLYDPLEGGFFRYATRRNWSVPHFEKMLLENVQLTELMLQAALQFNQANYREAADTSLGYLLSHLYDEETGGFFGSQGADEVYYHLTRKERAQVSPPPVDRTSYAVSSARALITLLQAARLLDERRYLSWATQAADFLTTRMVGERGAYSYFDPKKVDPKKVDPKKADPKELDPAHDLPRLDGQLTDNAWLAEALLMTYQATGEKRYLDSAERIIGFAATHLYDPESGAFYSRHSGSSSAYRAGEQLLRTKELEDNGQMAKALHRVFQITGKANYREMLEGTAGYFFSAVQQGEFNASSATWQQLAEQLLASGRYP
tara:strand:+ start:1182 stop:2936 length:1755 start_codon:yes stop_codon:yes gene_type:complete